MDRIEFDGNKLNFSSEGISGKLEKETVIHGDFIISAGSIILLMIALSDKPLYYDSTCRLGSFSNYFHCVYSNEEIEKILQGDIHKMTIDIDIYREKLSRAESKIIFLENKINRHNEGGWIERLKSIRYD